MDLAILLDIPYIRQILGFFFLTLLPCLLILQILKLDKIGSTEKVVLSVGLSISFLMLFGLLINNLSLYVGYETPLSTIPLLFSFNIAFVVIAIIGYKINKDKVFSLPNLNLNTSEKAFLTIPILFPALSILGTHIMKTTDNNIVLMFVLFLIAFYVLFASLFNQKFPKRIYPLVILLISISVLMIYMLRFPHIHGRDVHVEYYLFQTTLDNLHWGALIFGDQLDACLSISLLPSIFQSIMNVNAQESLFKGVCISIVSFTPLAIYVTSKKYIGESYAFLASFFFISQSQFLRTALSPRTSVAIFFVALAVMVFFNDKIDPLKRRILFIIFMLSTVVSHYSTTYIFFFILLFSWFAIEIFSRRFTFKKSITLTIVLLFFAFIFFWYSQITETAFNSGVAFVENTFLNLNRFFIAELREPGYSQLAGQGLEYGIVSKANLVVTWCTFILIGIGVLTMNKRYKEMISIPDIKIKKPDFLKTKFEMEYLAMALVCSGVLVSMVALPYISTGYQIGRLYLLVVIILSVCFIIGGVTLSNLSLNLLRKVLSKMLRGKKALPKTLFASKKPLRKNISQQSFKKHFTTESAVWGNGSEVQAYLIILLILIPYFLFMTAAMHQICGIPASITLNSVGKEYDMEYLHDQESCAAKWLKGYAEMSIGSHIHTTDPFVKRKLISHGVFSPHSIVHYSFFKHWKIRDYIYLSYNNVVNDKFPTEKGTFNRTEFNRSDYTDVFVGKNEIYDNGGSEIWH